MKFQQWGKIEPWTDEERALVDERIREHRARGGRSPMELRIARTSVTAICAQCGELVELSGIPGAKEAPYLECFLSGCAFMGRNPTKAEEMKADMRYRPTLPHWF